MRVVSGRLDLVSSELACTKLTHTAPSLHLHLLYLYLLLLNYNPPTRFGTNSEFASPSFAGHSSMLIAGWSDASSGPLIPFIRQLFSQSPFGRLQPRSPSFRDTDPPSAPCRVFLRHQLHRR